MGYVQGWALVVDENVLPKVKLTADTNIDDAAASTMNAERKKDLGGGFLRSLAGKVGVDFCSVRLVKCKFCSLGFCQRIPALPRLKSLKKKRPQNRLKLAKIS